jgi:hypothetical protein
MEFELVAGFIENVQIVTTSNYRAIANSHTQQFTTARTKSSHSAFVFTSRCMATVFNAADPSTSMFISLPAGDCLTTNEILDLSCL